MPTNTFGLCIGLERIFKNKFPKTLVPKVDFSKNFLISQFLTPFHDGFSYFLKTSEFRLRSKFGYVCTLRINSSQRILLRLCCYRQNFQTRFRIPMLGEMFLYTIYDSPNKLSKMKKIKCHPYSYTY